MLVTISNKDSNGEEWIDLKLSLEHVGYHVCLRDIGNYDTVFEITERRITEEIPPFEPEAEVNVNPTTKENQEMAMLLNPFDATQVDPSAAPQQLPVGNHKVVIVANSIEATKDNSGGYLDLTLQVIEGECAGMQGHYRLNLYNQSDKAREIAYKQLSAICHVTGVFQVNDANVLMNIPFIAVVGLQKKAKQDDPDYTEIKGVKDINGNDPGKQGQGQQQQQPQNQQFQQQQVQQQQPANNGNWNNQGQQQQNQQQPANGGGWNQPQNQQQGNAAATGGPAWSQNK